MMASPRTIMLESSYSQSAISLQSGWLIVTGGPVNWLREQKISYPQEIMAHTFNNGSIPFSSYRVKSNRYWYCFNHVKESQFVRSVSHQETIIHFSIFSLYSLLCLKPFIEMVPDYKSYSYITATLNVECWLHCNLE